MCQHSPSSLQTTAADTEAVVNVKALAPMNRDFAKAFMIASILLTAPKRVAAWMVSGAL
jgi:hypothetical protein